MRTKKAALRSEEAPEPIRKMARPAAERITSNGLRVEVLASGRILAHGDALAATVTRHNLGTDITIPLAECSLRITMGHAATFGLAGALTQSYRRNHPLARVGFEDANRVEHGPQTAASARKGRATGAKAIPAARRK